MQSNHTLSEKWGSFGYNVSNVHALLWANSILASFVRPDLRKMGIHQRIIQFNHYICRQLAVGSSSVMPRNLSVETFTRIDSRILISNACFWLDINIYEVLLMFRESLLVLSQLSTPTSSLHWGMNIVNITVGCKNCFIISKMNKAHLVWGSMHVIDIQNKKYWAQYLTLRKT